MDQILPLMWYERWIVRSFGAVAGMVSGGGAR